MTEPTNEPELNLNSLEVYKHKVYDIVCTPFNKSGPLSTGPIPIMVIAANSSTATRKATAFFRELFPKESVIGIEVLQFVCRGDHLVVGAENG